MRGPLLALAVLCCCTVAPVQAKAQLFDDGGSCFGLCQLWSSRPNAAAAAPARRGTGEMRRRHRVRFAAWTRDRASDAESVTDDRPFRRRSAHRTRSASPLVAAARPIARPAAAAVQPAAAKMVPAAFVPPAAPASASPTAPSVTAAPLE